MRSLIWHNWILDDIYPRDDSSEVSYVRIYQPSTGDKTNILYLMPVYHMYIYIDKQNHNIANLYWICKLFFTNLQISSVKQTDCCFNSVAHGQQKWKFQKIVNYVQEEKLCVYERNRHIGRYISGGHDTQTYIYEYVHKAYRITGTW
jgi:hypothetical protein